MNTIHVSKGGDYAAISTAFLRDEKLSLKAKGFMAMVMSMPESQDFTVEKFVGMTPEGEHAVYAVIRELKDAGYCTAGHVRDAEKGRFTSVKYTFFDKKPSQSAEKQPRCGFPDVDNPDVENPDVENRDVAAGVLKVVAEASDADAEAKKKAAAEADVAAFEECWKAYRRKGSKARARECWRKLTPTQKALVLPHVQAYVASRDLCYQQDFERYLRNGTYRTTVIVENRVVYDPEQTAATAATRADKYRPSGRNIWFNGETQTYWSDWNFYDGRIYDGYDDRRRPDGARVTLNNGRGTLTWDARAMKWRNDRDAVKNEDMRLDF